MTSHSPLLSILPQPVCTCLFDLQVPWKQPGGIPSSAYLKNEIQHSENGPSSASLSSEQTLNYVYMHVFLQWPRTAGYLYVKLTKDFSSVKKSICCPQCILPEMAGLCLVVHATSS